MLSRYTLQLISLARKKIIAFPEPIYTTNTNIQQHYMWMSCTACDSSR